MGFKIELKNIGRGKVCKTIYSPTNTIEETEDVAARAVRCHLTSKDVDLLPKENVRGIYAVTAGFHTVGEVVITEA